MNTNFLPESNDDLAITIVEMSCRFPRTKNIADFWQNLVDVVGSTTYLSSNQYNDKLKNLISMKLRNKLKLINFSPIFTD